MPERVDDVLGRLASVEDKVDSLSQAMSHRFDEVAEAFVEHRRYTDFAYERLDARIAQLDGRLNARISQLDGRLDERISQLDARLDARIAQLDAKLDGRITVLEAKVDSGFARLDRKLDQLIDRA